MASAVLSPVHQDSSKKGYIGHPPIWACDLVRGAEISAAEDGVELLQSPKHRVGLVTARVKDAVAMRASEFRDRVCQTYKRISAVLCRSATPRPIRVWNHIPAIHGPMSDGLDRYMVFNQGRYAAYESWFGGAAAFPRHVPTATGVGHDGSDLVIHVLASAGASVGIENPRQRPAYLYSAKFGPRPPCFARATIADVDGRRMLLVGGTASVKQEDSVHVGDLNGQIEETFENLRTLVRSAMRVCGKAIEEESDPLRLLTFARAYVLRGRDMEQVEAAVCAKVKKGAKVEVVQAEVCRKELLTEIEAMAMLPMPEPSRDAKAQALRTKK